MSFPPAVPAGASHLLSPAAQRDAETDVSVRAERARLAGNEWEFDYAALHSQANTIKRLAGRTQRMEAPSLLLQPCSWRLSFRSSPAPALPSWDRGAAHPLPWDFTKTQRPARSEGRRNRRRQRTAISSPWPLRAPTSLSPAGPASSPLCPAFACACDQAPLLFTLQSSPLCSALWVIFSSLAQNSL